MKERGDGPSDEPTDAAALKSVKDQIDQSLRPLNAVRDELIKTRSAMIRLLRASSKGKTESETEKINQRLQTLHQQELELGEQLGSLQKTHDELWALYRLIKNGPAAPTSESPEQIEERKLRWRLIDAKNAQMQAAEDWAASTDPEERARREENFNLLRDEYHRIYEMLTRVRERQKQG
jgi:hypothetical protein